MYIHISRETAEIATDTVAAAPPLSQDLALALELSRGQENIELDADSDLATELMRAGLIEF